MRYIPASYLEHANLQFASYPKTQKTKRGELALGKSKRLPGPMRGVTTIDASTSSGCAGFFTRLDPARVYAWLGGLSLLVLVFLVPPFQVPDEPQHFFRSFQLSRLEVWSRGQNGVRGSYLPSSLPDLVQHFMGTNELHTTRVVPAQKLTDTVREMKRSLDPERAVFVEFGTTAYAPIPYLPAALAIGAGRNFGVGPLGLFYLGRFSNALAAMLITCVALRLFPAGRETALVIALLPMTQFMTASLSPDATTIACAMLFTATLARFLTDSAWPAKRMLVAFASGAVMCSVKAVYVPLLFAGLGTILVRERLANRGIRRALVQQLAAAGIIIVLLGVWLGSNFTVGTHSQAGVDIGGQITFLRYHPEQFFVTVLRSFYMKAEFLSVSTVGMLGWLNLPLSNWVYGALALAILLSAYVGSCAPSLPISVVAWLVLVAAASVLLIELALYLTWTPVGSLMVEGVQGRYFIPALPLIGFATISLLSRFGARTYSTQAYACLLVIVGVITVAMHVVIIEGYGLF